jgi:hypothetical protein
MKHQLFYVVWLVLLSLFTGTTAWGQLEAAPAYQWAKNGGGAGDDRGESVAVDAAGNTFVAGFFQQTVTFGSVTLVGRGDYDVYLAKYSPQGQLQWLRQAGGPGREFPWDIAVDAAGSVYLTGSFGTFNGRQPTSMLIGSITLTGGSQYDEMFLAKYDAQGTMLWARQTVGDGPSYGEELAVDRAGNVVLTGVMSWKTRFDQFTFALGNSLNLYVAKYTSQGRLQ